MNYRRVWISIAIFIVIPVFFKYGISWADQYQDNIVIILDASGSMNENFIGIKKMDAAKSALWEVVKKTPNTINIGLLVFSAKNVKNDWVYPLGPRNDAKLYESINLPQPGGDTPLGKYIKKGADRLLEQREKQYGYGSYRLLIVTDGKAQDQDLVDKYVPDVLSRGIITDVIGVDMKEEHILANMVHSYRKADDPESLKEAVSQVFAEISIEETDTAREDAFGFLEGIPDELAVKMIKALSSSGNYPIGTKPIAIQTVKEEMEGTSKIESTSKDSTEKSSGFPLTQAIIILALVVFIVVIFFLRRPLTRKDN